MTQTHADLIDRLGGGTAVAEALAQFFDPPPDRDLVYKWKKNGVPWKFRLQVAELAKSKNVPLPDDFLGPANGGQGPGPEPEKAAS
jgi:hypothetical protein